MSAQMRNAIAAGFDGIIVYNIEPNARKNISYSHFPSINAFDGKFDRGFASWNRFPNDNVISTSGLRDPGHPHLQ